MSKFFIMYSRCVDSEQHHDNTRSKKQRTSREIQQEDPRSVANIGRQPPTSLRLVQRCSNVIIQLSIACIHKCFTVQAHALQTAGIYSTETLPFTRKATRRHQE